MLDFHRVFVLGLLHLGGQRADLPLLFLDPCKQLCLGFLSCEGLPLLGLVELVTVVSGDLLEPLLLFARISQLLLQVLDTASEHSQVLIDYDALVTLHVQPVLSLLGSDAFFSQFLGCLLVEIGDLGLVLLNKLLLRIMSLVTELFDDGLDLTVPLLHHLFAGALLDRHLVVLELPESLFDLDFVLCEHLFAHALDLCLVAPFDFGKASVSLGSFLLDGVSLLGLQRGKLRLERLVLSPPQGLDPVVLSVDVALPAHPLLVELALEPLVLLVQFGLVLLSFRVQGSLLLVEETATKLLDLVVVLDQHGFLHLANSLGVSLVAFPQLVLVLLDDALDLWLEALDGLGANLLHLFLLPALLTNLLGGDPCVTVLLQLNSEPVLQQLLLLLSVGAVFGQPRRQLFDLLMHLLFVLEQGLKHCDLLLDTRRHLGLDLLSVLAALVSHQLQLLLMLGLLPLPGLLQHLERLGLLVALELHLHHALADLVILGGWLRELRVDSGDDGGRRISRCRRLRVIRHYRLQVGGFRARGRCLDMALQVFFDLCHKRHQFVVLGRLLRTLLLGLLLGLRTLRESGK